MVIDEKDKIVYCGVSQAEIDRFLSAEIVENFLAKKTETIQNPTNWSELATQALIDEEAVEEFSRRLENKKSEIDRTYLLQNQSLNLADTQLFIRDRGLDDSPHKKDWTEVEESFRVSGLVNLFTLAEVEATSREEYNWKEPFAAKIEANRQKLRAEKHAQLEIFRDYRRLREKLVQPVAKIKDLINQTGLDTDEILDYVPPAQGLIYQNWLNHLGQMQSAGQTEIEMEQWVEANFGWKTLFDLTTRKKEFYEEIKAKWQEFLSDDDLAEFKTELRKNDGNRTGGIFMTQVFPYRRKVIKSLQEKIAHSLDPILINTLLIAYAEDKILYYKEKLVAEPSWESYVNQGEVFVDVEIREHELNHRFEEFNNEEFIAEKKAVVVDDQELYAVLELPADATEETIKSRYKKLSLLHHPDRGGDPEEFKKISNAYKKILGEKKDRLKYDLCLLEDKNGDYANPQGWSKFIRSTEPVDQKFGEQIKSILQDELEAKELTLENIADYGRRWKWEEFANFRQAIDGEEELIRIDDFCLKDKADGGIIGLSPREAIEKTRIYLDIIFDGFSTGTKLKQVFASLGISSTEYGEKLFEKSLVGNQVTREELTKPGSKHSCFRELERKRVEVVYEEDKNLKAQLKKAANDYDLWVSTRVHEVKKVKDKLTAELVAKLAQGESILNSEDKKKISEFLTEFEGFLTALREQGSYEAELTKAVVVAEEEYEEDTGMISGKTGKPIIRTRKRKKYADVAQKVEINQVAVEKVIETQQNEIDRLIGKLRSANEVNEPAEREEEINETPILIQSEPITEEQKKPILDYLNDLVFELAPSNRKAKNSSNLRYIKNTILGLELDWEMPLKEAQNWEQAEDIRHKAIKNICGMIKGQGGSDDVLVVQEERILKNLALILAKEIGEKIELSSEQEKMLVVDFKNEINDSARKLTESKRKILSKISKSEEVPTMPEETNFPEPTEEENTSPDQATNQTIPPLDQPKPKEKRYLLRWLGTEQVNGTDCEKFAVIKGSEKEELKFYSTFFGKSGSYYANPGVFIASALREFKAEETYQLTTLENFVVDSQGIIQGVEKGVYKIEKISEETEQDEQPKPPRKIITLDWKNISLDFNEALKEAWEAESFDYYQVKEWIEIGIKVDEYSLCAWLRDNIKLTPEQVLNLPQGKLEELRKQYAEVEYQEQNYSGWEETERERERERETIY